MATARRLTDDDIGAPSRLPRWTVGHVLTHIARNADGQRRMAEGAARSEVLDQYVGGVDGRAAAIEAGAARPAAAQLTDVEHSAAALASAWASMPAGAWANRIRPTRGECAASDGPRLRLFEVEVHHTDLGRDYQPRDWPVAFVELGLERIVAILRARATTIGPPTVWRVAPLDTGDDITVRRDLTGTTVAVGPFGDRADAVVTAPAHDLLAWLLGRLEAPPGAVDGDVAVAAQLPAAYPWQ